MSIAAHLEKLAELVGTAENEYASLQRQLLEKLIGEEQLLESAFKDIPASQGKTGRQIGTEYQALLKQIEQIRPKKTALQHRETQLHELYNQRKKLLIELDQQSSARASAMQASVKKLTRRLKQQVRLSLNVEGNRQVLVDFLVQPSVDRYTPRSS